MKIMLCDIGSIEQLHNKGLLPLLNLLGGTIYIADLIFDGLSVKVQNQIQSQGDIEIVKFDSQSISSSLIFKTIANIHLADCVSLLFCKQYGITIFSDENIVCEVANSSEINQISTTEICENLIKKMTG
ncbi:hypothetical protein G5B10_00775 [Fluviicola sp. SGL-29]|nr:hypothetical protein [Fluviicola sp. SGL-29]